ncbi:MAG: hypothetical protein NC126_08850 [Clostridium sp.]|nr:hypothetical protein [Clostridium sp.]
MVNQNDYLSLKFGYHMDSGKGTSLFTFFKRKLSAGMTVEAALVLPLFLFFFLNLSCALEMIRLQGNLELALWETGSKLSVYGHILSANPSEKEQAKKSGQNEILAELGDIAFSYLYVRNAVTQYVGEEYLEQSPLTHGVNGLQFLESEIFTEGDCFEIVMTYEVSTWMDIPGIRPFRMWNRYYGHIWNGYEISGTGEAGRPADETVYVAENGVVYHKTPDCTHLQLTIQEVDKEQVGNKRNAGGGKYTICEKCGKGASPETVFIGKEGDRFHYDRGCAGLKRTYFSILLSDAGKYRPCSRCSKP